MSKKLTIENMQKFAKEHNGKCLSKNYFGRPYKLKWQCVEGHTFEASFASLRKSWCPYCSRAQSIGERICRKVFEVLFDKKFPKIRPNWLINSKGNRMEFDGYCKELYVAFEYHGKQHYEEVKHFNKKTPLEERKKYDEEKRNLCKENGICLIEIPFTLEFDKIGEYIYKECKNRQIKTLELPVNFNYRLLDIYSPLFLAEMKKIAKERGGECLSERYINSETNLKWKCKEGHIWKATQENVKRGSWCPVCCGTLKLNIKEIKELAKSRGGECLSDKYVNGKTKLKWRCKEGHTWFSRPVKVKNANRWCPYCGGSMKLTIEQVKAFALRKGIECISNNYVNAHKKLKWKCKEGHIWEAEYATIYTKKENLCPQCAGFVFHTIEEVKDFGIKMGGECLSDKYINVDSKLLWKCVKGHTWKKSFYNVKNRGYWCPYCNNKRELILEKIKTIVSQKGGECISKKYLNPRKKLSFKCQLKHSWKMSAQRILAGGWCPKCRLLKFMKEMQEFANKNGGVCLSKNVKTLSTPLRWRCKDGHVWSANAYTIRRGYWCSYCKSNPELKLDLARKLAKERGGDCLSESYLSVDSKMKWSCDKGHEWMASLYNIKNRRYWCPKCNPIVKITLEDAKKIAESRGGECLSESYFNVDSKMKWSCDKGHEWTASLYNIKNRKQWCPYCAKNVKLTLELAKKIAKERGGKCLSKSYFNIDSKLKWKCAKGHKWASSLYNIKNKKYWCPHCAKNQRKLN